MNIEFQRICGLYGRCIQLLSNARKALQDAYTAHKEQISSYERCLDHANMQAEINRQWAIDAKRERDYFEQRALAAEAENFKIKNNQ